MNTPNKCPGCGAVILYGRPPCLACRRIAAAAEPSSIPGRLPDPIRGRIGKPYNRAKPKLRKSQMTTRRRARFSLNRWLGRGGLSFAGVMALATPRLIELMSVQLAYREAMKLIAAERVLERPDAAAVIVLMTSPATWEEAGSGAMAANMAEGWRLALRDSQRNLAAAVHGSAGGAHAG